MKRSLVFMAWGEKYTQLVADCLDRSQLPDCSVVLITDEATNTDCLPSFVEVVRKPLQFKGKLAKVELLRNLPDDLELVLFLDVDTIILDDLSLGFEKAEKHGLAMAPAPHYSLEHFRSFGVVMDRFNVPKQGQLLYNSGVMFFDAKNTKIIEIFDLACKLAEEDTDAYWSDQPYITLAIEMLGVNPYTLSPSFNHRAFGEPVSGNIRIWHTYLPMPSNATALEPGYLHHYRQGQLVKLKKVPI